MPSVTRSGWRRVKASIAAEVATSLTDHAERETEILRQLSDVFKELNRLSVDIGTLKSQLDELTGKVDSETAAIAELSDAMKVQLEVENQSTELLGRLVQSARARLEVVESAVQGSG